MKKQKLLICHRSGYLDYGQKRIVKNENSGSGGSLYPANTVKETPDDIIKKHVYADDPQPSGSGGSLYPAGLEIKPKNV